MEGRSPPDSSSSRAGSFKSPVSTLKLISSIISWSLSVGAKRLHCPPDCPLWQLAHSVKASKILRAWFCIFTCAEEAAESWVHAGLAVPIQGRLPYLKCTNTSGKSAIKGSWYSRYQPLYLARNNPLITLSARSSSSRHTLVFKSIPTKCLITFVVIQCNL